MKMTPTRILIAVASGLVLLCLIVFGLVAWENVDSSQIVVHQDFTSGELTVWDDAGMHYAGMGNTKAYDKSSEFKFLARKARQEGDPDDTSNCFPTRFNDKGKAWVCGQLSFDLPTDAEQVKVIHSKYRSLEAVRERIVLPSISRAIFNSGPLMSSKESAGSRRGELLTFIQDQATEGVYVTKTVEVEVEDGIKETVEMIEVPKLNEDGTVVVDKEGKEVMVKKGLTKSVPNTRKVDVLQPVYEDGKFKVREVSVAKERGVKLYGFNITGIYYEKKVQDQIDAQRDMEMSIQTKIAEAVKARQDAITEEQSGRARAAKAKWDQEVIKAKEITLAEQQLEVARKDLDKAQLEKQADITRAEGEAKAKELVMEADGALDKKLAAWKEVALAQAANIGKQRWVPDVQVGGDGSSSSGVDIMQLLAIKAAKDLSLDMQPKGKR